jgi:predicted TIM-barrel fold metal-dependent hydrolase
MPIDVGAPLIDHHCHGLVPRNLTRREFEKMISESFVDAPAGTSHFDAPVGLAIRAKCAELIDLGPFPNVYFDVGVILNYTGAMSAHILGEALELSPFTKQLYSSDAFGVAEFYYLGALLYRKALASHLDRWIADGMCNTHEAERIVRLIASENTRRIYPLE